MDILVTGAKGFVGGSLVRYLRTLADGRNRTRPGLEIGEVFEYDLGSTPAELDEWCARAGFVVHLAGVNRPREASEFREGNCDFTATLLGTLRAHGNACPVALSSSVQATLAGRFGDSEYGRSKRAAEGLLFEHEKATGAPAYVYRYPNVVGAGARPNYNSAVATFCHNYAHGLPITVSDPAVELELLFVADLIEELLDAMEGRPHRCEWPAAGEVVDGVAYDGVTPRPSADGRYCHCPVTHRATLGQIVGLLDRFREHPRTLMAPDLTPGCLEKKLYSMYLSYLPPEGTVFDLQTNEDERGSFTELARTPASGQVSVNITRPGVTKGMHWHVTKTEEFIVVAGRALIRERRVGTDEVEEYVVDGSRIQSVVMKPGFTHDITNIGDADLVTVMTCNEVFDPDRPDTYYEPVV